MEYNAAKGMKFGYNHNMVELQKHSARWNKPDTIGQILIISLNEVSRTGRFIETERRGEFTGGGMELGDIVLLILSCCLRW